VPGAREIYRDEIQSQQEYSAQQAQDVARRHAPSVMTRVAARIVRSPYEVSRSQSRRYWARPVRSEPAQR
jgi:hypothetical protein